MSTILRVQATCIALRIDDDLVGVLLRGAPGTGKSDLALRLIDQGALLLADDLVELEAKAGRLLASPPETIRGRMEVRGLGIATFPWVEEVPLGLIVDLVPPQDVPRQPEAALEEISGVQLRRLRLAPFESSATAKIRLALQWVKGT